ncbi:hypothetical protein ACFQHO_11515 [Actinomadura yumaensis]|uniref:hypothetical protein n=1 Tax=Actinomadura yumaensis TaxID=111807 RepID=UPI003614FD56
MVLDLLKTLRAMDASGLWTTLAARAAEEMPVRDMRATTALLDLFRDHARDTARGFAARAAVGVPLDRPHAVVGLLDAMDGMGFAAASERLAERAARETPLDDPNDVAALLVRLARPGTFGKAELLAARAVSCSLAGPRAVVLLLRRLQALGMTAQARNSRSAPPRRCG